MENTSQRFDRLPLTGQLYAYETEQFWDRAVGLFVTVNIAFAYLVISAILMHRDAKGSAIEAAILAAALTLALPLAQVRLASALRWFPVTEERGSADRFRLFVGIAGFVSLASSGIVAALALFSSEGALDAVKRHLFEGTVFMVFLFRFLVPFLEHLRERRAQKNGQ
jgi:ABC-type Fe3+ transport system permease subunit